MKMTDGGYQTGHNREDQRAIRLQPPSEHPLQRGQDEYLYQEITFERVRGL